MGRQGWILSTLARLWDLILAWFQRGKQRLRQMRRPNLPSFGAGFGLRSAPAAGESTQGLGAIDSAATERTSGAPNPTSEAAASSEDATEPLPTDDVLVMLEQDEREDEIVFTPDPATDSDDSEMAFIPDPDMAFEFAFDFVTGDDGSGDDFAEDVSLGSQSAEVDGIASAEGNGWVRGDGSKVCPDGYPIKGNGHSHIYHLPGAASYAATIPEFCFETEEAAAAQGFRPPRRSRTSQ